MTVACSRGVKRIIELNNNNSTALGGNLPARIILSLLIALFLLPGHMVPTHAQPRVPPDEDGILAIGTASLTEGNIADARQRALADALRKGVEEDLLRRLGGELLAGRISRFVEELVPAARSEIANYNILGEEESGSVYRVLVRLRTNEQTLETILEDLGFLREEGPAASVLFLVSRRSAGLEEPDYWWKDPESSHGHLLPVELFLRQAFEGMGFAMAGRTLEVPEGERPDRLGAADLTVEDAVEWGRLCRADIVIKGSCVEVDDMISLFLKVLDVSSASVLAEKGAQSTLDPEQEGRERINDGIRRAVENVSQELEPLVRRALRPVAPKPSHLTLNLKGIESFTQLQSFSRFVQGSVPGVESITQTRFKGDTVTFAVGYRGDPDHFLMNMLSRPDQPFPMTAHKDDSGEIVVSPL